MIIYFLLILRFEIIIFNMMRLMIVDGNGTDFFIFSSVLAKVIGVIMMYESVFTSAKTNLVESIHLSCKKGNHQWPNVPILHT